MSKIPSNCDYCLFFEYDEEEDCYVCSKDLDEDEIVNEKMSRNEAKYPVDRAKGKSDKYNKL